MRSKGQGQGHEIAAVVIVKLLGAHPRRCVEIQSMSECRNSHRRKEITLNTCCNVRSTLVSGMFHCLKMINYRGVFV